MSKTDQVSIVERHLEKMILAVVVVLLGLSLFRYFASSPRRVELAMVRGKQTVPPAKVDALLHDEVSRVEEEVLRAPAERQEVADYLRQVQALQTPQAGAGLMGVLATPLASVNAVGPDVQPIELAALEAALPAPDKPTVIAGREMPYQQTGAEETDTAHVICIYPWSGLDGQWRELLRQARVPSLPVVAGVEAQAQVQQEDGAWSDPVAVSGAVPPDEKGQPFVIPEMPAFDGANGDKVNSVIVQLGDIGWQEDILQPVYYQIWWAGRNWLDWTTKLPKTEVTTAWEDEKAKPKEPVKVAMAPKPQAVVRRGRASNLPGSPKFEGINMAEMMAEYLRTEGQDEEADSSDREQIVRDRRQKSEERAKQRAEEAAKAPEAPQPTFVPDLEWQKQLGKVLVWLHDSSLQPGRTYRYRMRLKFINPLLTYANSVVQEQDARQPYVYSPYSQWSDPVRVPRVTEFFVTGQSNNAVRVAIFTRHYGQEVMDQFTVLPGQPIGAVKAMTLTHPVNGTSDSVSVDFDTQAIAVGADFNKPNPGSTSGRPAVELLYLDEQGLLRTTLDINHQPRGSPEAVRYKELEEQVRLARKAAEATAATP